MNAVSYVVCIDNTDYTASLEKHKIYRVVRDEAARKKRFGTPTPHHIITAENRLTTPYTP